MRQCVVLGFELCGGFLWVVVVVCASVGCVFGLWGFCCRGIVCGGDGVVGGGCFEGCFNRLSFIFGFLKIGFS